MLQKNSEKAMAHHSSTLAWKIPWTEEPGRLQSMGWRRVGHNWVTSLSLSCIGEGNGKLLQCSCLENPRDGGAWWAAVYGVAQRRTWLKRLSSSSSMMSAQGGVCHLLNFSQTLNKLWPVFSYCTLFIYLASCAGSYGEGNGTPLQYSCLENHGQRTLVGCSPWGH